MFVVLSVCRSVLFVLRQLPCLVWRSRERVHRLQVRRRIVPESAARLNGLFLFFFFSPVSSVVCFWSFDELSDRPCTEWPWRRAVVQAWHSERCCDCTLKTRPLPISPASHFPVSVSSPDIWTTTRTEGLTVEQGCPTNGSNHSHLTKYREKN